MGPFTVFIAIWATVIALHSITIFSFYEPFSPVASGLLAASALIAWLVARWFVPAFKSLTPVEAQESIRNAERFRDAVFIGATCIFVFETIMFGGVPVIWMMTGVPKGYADFGYPTLHGIFNGMLMFVTSASGAFAVMGSRRRRNAALFVIGIVVMAALYSRAMLVITLIQVAGVVLFRLRSHFTVLRAAGMVLVTIAGLFAFGVLGNIRSQHGIDSATEMAITPTLDNYNIQERPPAENRLEPIKSASGLLTITNVGYNPFIGMISEERKWVFSLVPTEFLWAYAYITSGYNNLLYNLQITPTMNPATTLSKLVPTIVYSAFGATKQVDNFNRAHPTFTVSTAFAGPVSDFGYLGFLLVVPLLVGTAAAYRGARAGSARALLLYAMLFQSLLLTPYIDTVLYTTFVLQLVLAFLSGVDLSRLIPAMKGRSAEQRAS